MLEPRRPHHIYKHTSLRRAIKIYELYIHKKEDKKQLRSRYDELYIKKKTSNSSGLWCSIEAFGKGNPGEKKERYFSKGLQVTCSTHPCTRYQQSQHSQHKSGSSASCAIGDHQAKRSLCWQIPYSTVQYILLLITQIFCNICTFGTLSLSQTQEYLSTDRTQCPPFSGSCRTHMIVYRAHDRQTEGAPRALPLSHKAVTAEAGGGKIRTSHSSKAPLRKTFRCIIYVWYDVIMTTVQTVMMYIINSRFNLAKN